MSDSLRIGLVATANSPVAQTGSASIENHIWVLTRELTRLGHDVTTYGIAGSDPVGHFVETLPGSYGIDGSPNDWRLCEWISLATAVADSGSLDVLHAHAYLWGMPLESLSSAPMLHTLHVMPSEDHVALWQRYSRGRVVALSQAQWTGKTSLRPRATIYHGVDETQFEFNDTPGDYLLFLGELKEAKGPLEAIEVARRLGIRLVLAGQSTEYFEDVLSKHVDDVSVEYAGPVYAQDRAALLSSASALLYPVRYPEPFGLVLVEAMISGTPVAAIGIGAVPEIVAADVTGSFVSGTQDLPRAVEVALTLDRRQVRRHALQRFSAARMGLEYSRLYQEIAL